VLSRKSWIATKGPDTLDTEWTPHDRGERERGPQDLSAALAVSTIDEQWLLCV